MVLAQILLKQAVTQLLESGQDAALRKSFAMHIMEVVSGSGFNGATKYSCDLSLSLRNHGHRVTAVCLPDSWIGARLSEAQIPVVTSGLERWPFQELKRIAAVCRQEDVDVVHTHNSRAHFFGVLLRQFFSIPTVATAHQNHIQLHWRFNDHVVANSDATLAFHRRFNLVRRAHSSRIYCPINTDAFQSASEEAIAQVKSQWNASHKQLVVGIVGNVAENKGHMFLIRAWPKILAAVPHAKLVIVGTDTSDYASAVRREIAKLQIEPAIHWAGHQSNVPEIMQALDLVVCASLSEAFGLTAAEALAAGKPVVATKVGGLPETVLHQETGLLVDPGNATALATSITQLLLDGQKRERLGKAGQQRVCQLFSNTNHIAALEAVFEQVAQRRKQSSRAA
jgi:glycosyltransferase involved in cell wall biosynthesis